MLPSHLTSPNEPSKSKLVMPELWKCKPYLRRPETVQCFLNQPNIFDRSGKAELSMRKRPQLRMRCVSEVSPSLGRIIRMKGIV